MRQFNAATVIGVILYLLVLCSQIDGIASFQIYVRANSIRSHHRIISVLLVSTSAAGDNFSNTENIDGDESTTSPSKGMEKAWRYAKKSLLSIGAKGATASHGNSLRQLLQDHTIVKVKISTQSYVDLQAAFEHLRELAVASGAPFDVELLQSRESEKIILLGMPGAKNKIEAGEFPPAPVIWEPKVNKE